MASVASSSDEVSSSESKQDRLQKLRDLRLRMNEARKLNHNEVVEEDRRNKQPKNAEAKQRRVEWEVSEEEKRKECLSQGIDYERVKNLELNAIDAEQLDRKKKKKKNPDEGFSDYAAASYRQYQRLTKQMKPDMDAYNREKEKMGDVFYAEKDSLGVLEHKDSEEAIDRLVVDVEKQIEKRAKYSRRRAHDEDADIDYINERNMKFNKKLERFYGTYTSEIKQNLERGTAI